MTESAFQASIIELKSRIAALPSEQRPALMQLLAETIERHSEIRENVAAAHDALDDWRLTLKYYIFDLEARAREHQA